MEYIWFSLLARYCIGRQLWSAIMVMLPRVFRIIIFVKNEYLERLFPGTIEMKWKCS